MPKYRKKPIVNEAFQMTLINMASNADWPTWLHEAWQADKGNVGSLYPMGNTLFVVTLEGPLTVSPNDWIIQGVNGEIYPCKPDIFEKTYELVTEPTDIPNEVA